MAPVVSPSSAAAKPGRCVLVVDDEPGLVELVADVAEPLDCRILTAANLAEAKQLLATHDVAGARHRRASSRRRRRLAAVAAPAPHRPAPAPSSSPASPASRTPSAPCARGRSISSPSRSATSMLAHPPAQGHRRPGPRRQGREEDRAAPPGRQAAQRRPPDHQQEGRPALQRPGQRLRRAVQAARRRPHAGGVPQVRRRRQGPGATALPRHGLAAPPARLQQRRRLAGRRGRRVPARRVHEVHRPRRARPHRRAAAGGPAAGPADGVARLRGAELSDRLTPQEFEVPQRPRDPRRSTAPTWANRWPPWSSSAPSRARSPKTTRRC